MRRRFFVLKCLRDEIFQTVLYSFLFCAFIQSMAAVSMASELPEQPFQLSQAVTAPHEKKSSRSTDKQPLVIRDITFQLDNGGKEKVLIFSTRFFTPSVAAVEGDRPRFVIDIPYTDSVKEGLKTIPVGGRFIKRIRTRHDGTSGTFRIVLDLRPEENYNVNQTFFEAENIYVIDVEQDRDFIEK